MLTVAIVEDDRAFGEVLIEYLLRYEKEKNITIQAQYFPDGEDITEHYRSDFDLILMDIQMRFMDGLEAARRIRQMDNDVCIMFITSTAEFAISGYEVRAFDYVMKPLPYETFAAKLDRAVAHLSYKPDASLLLQVENGVERVRMRDILFIESQGHVMLVHTATGVHSTYARMNDFEDQLTGAEGLHFFRCNKGYLVNMDEVEGMQDGDCLIRGTRVPVSRRRRDEFMKLLTEIL